MTTPIVPLHSPLLRAAFSFSQFATSRTLAQVFGAQSGRPMAAGYDRVTYRVFDRHLSANCDLIAAKVGSASYVYTPYREKLLPKGAEQPPRCISVPTLRDRLLLSALKEFLHLAAPSAIPRRLPSEHIRTLNAFLTAQRPAGLVVVRLDIKSYFSSIPHKRLLSILASLINCNVALRFVWGALRTPTLPLHTSRLHRRSQRNRKGVPQGLPVSNFLANSYLLGFDASVAPLCTYYARYVDDLLLIVPNGEVEGIVAHVGDELRALDLVLNDRKRTIVPADQQFEFLGYSISWPRLSVRRSNQLRFLNAVARLFTRYRHRSLEGDFPSWLSAVGRKEVFLHELNERITGAISGRRRYGWVFYFLEMNDVSLLKAFDSIVAGFFRRLRDFGGAAPPELKSLARAYYEARYSPEAGYILNYNQLVSTQDKLAHLLSRGAVSDSRAPQLTPTDVEGLFAKVRNRSLADLDQDVGFVY